MFFLNKKGITGAKLQLESEQQGPKVKPIVLSLTVLIYP